MSTVLLKNARLVNEGKVISSDVLIRNDRFEKIAPRVNVPHEKFEEINCDGKLLLPGVIDVHLHFREPGLTQKGDLESESKAALAGGITSFMEMPNTLPSATSPETVEEKFSLARRKAYGNYSFYIGATSQNLEELKKADPSTLAGIKIFMGSSTGNMLVDDPAVLEKIFAECESLIAIHAEEEKIIRENYRRVLEKYSGNLPPQAHPEIRNTRACLEASSKAVRWAQKYGTRLHILHLTTRDEISLFSAKEKPGRKNITTEACVHHLLFDKKDYHQLGNKIKCNPAIKEEHHKQALFQGLLDGHIDLISSDHAPHLAGEKNRPYAEAPAGIPMVQHTLPLMLEFHREKKIPLETIVEKMCHNPALCYNIPDRGFLREGYKADCLLVDMDQPHSVQSNDLLYKCGWSPVSGKILHAQITHTILNGDIAYRQGKFHGGHGERLKFDRQ